MCAFDLSSGKEYFKYANPRKTHFNQVKWLKDSSELVVADDTGHIMFVNIKGDKGQFEEKVTSAPILRFEIVQPTGYLVVSTQEEVIFYKINKGFQVQKLGGGHVGPVIGLYYLDFKRIHGSYVKSASRLLSIGDDNTIRVWDSVDQSEIACFHCPPDTEVTCMEYLPKFGLLVTGHENGDLYMWDVEIGNKIKLKNKSKVADTVCCLSHYSGKETDLLFSSGYPTSDQILGQNTGLGVHRERIDHHRVSGVSSAQERMLRQRES